MKLKRAYRTLLRLYPEDYKAMFAAEMWNTFEKAAEERRREEGLALVRFAFAELIGLMTGAAAEWIAKLTTDSSVRGRRPPDVRMMRPPGVPQQLWFAGACMSLGQGSGPDEVAEAENRIETLIARMVHAIANHDFPGARSYSYQEREAREDLRRLRQKHNLDE
ncbi:MAG: ATPase [Bryobacterales bacterium]|nr:ATPase [Bryobacterales bacterium]